MVGVFIAVLPYLGFPYIWKNIFFTLLGLGISFFAYILHKNSKVKKTEEKIFENFKENEIKTAPLVDELRPREEPKSE